MSEPRVKHRFRPGRYRSYECVKCRKGKDANVHNTQPSFTKVLFARMMGTKPNGRS